MRKRIGLLSVFCALLVASSALSVYASRPEYVLVASPASGTIEITEYIDENQSIVRSYSRKKPTILHLPPMQNFPASS